MTPTLPKALARARQTGAQHPTRAVEPRLVRHVHVPGARWGWTIDRTVDRRTAARLLRPAIRPWGLRGSWYAETEHDLRDVLACARALGPVWRSDALPLRVALECWGSAAGVAGAYYPDAIVTLAQSSAPLPRTLDLIHEAAHGAALARHRERDPEGAWPSPRDAAIVDGALVWETSVVTVLRPVDGAWVVEIHGEHPIRQRAAESVLLRAASAQVREGGTP